MVTKVTLGPTTNKNRKSIVNILLHFYSVLSVLNGKLLIYCVTVLLRQVTTSFMTWQKAFHVWDVSFWQIDRPSLNFPFVTPSLQWYNPHLSKQSFSGLVSNPALLWAVCVKVTGVMRPDSCKAVSKQQPNAAFRRPWCHTLTILW